MYESKIHKFVNFIIKRSKIFLFYLRIKNISNFITLFVCFFLLGVTDFSQEITNSVMFFVFIIPVLLAPP